MATTSLSRVAAWAARCSRPVGWVSLEAGDNDPARFLAYLIAALQSIDAGIGKGTLGALSSPQVPPVASLPPAASAPPAMLNVSVSFGGTVAAGAERFSGVVPGLLRRERLEHVSVLGRADHDAGPAEIAAELGITPPTVYRHLQAKYGKRKPGRKPKSKETVANGSGTP